MSDTVLANMLSTLAVQVHAFAICEIQSGWRLEKRGFEDTLLVHYVLRGTGTIAVDGQEPMPFGPNFMIIPPLNVAHSLGDPATLRTVKAGDALRVLHNGMVALTAGDGSHDILLACGSISATYADSLGLFDRLRAPLIEDLSGNDRLRYAFAFMTEELLQPGIGTQQVTSALMKQCLAILLRVHLSERGTNSPIFEALRDPRLLSAVETILNAPGASHTVESLAALCGMSRSVFAERFSATFGEGPIEYLHRARLRLAAQLLTTSPMPIKVIAASVGYASRSYFSHAFKSAYGLDPTAYRNGPARPAINVEPSPDVLSDIAASADEG